MHFFWGWALFSFWCNIAFFAPCWQVLPVCNLLSWCNLEYSILSSPHERWLISRMAQVAALLTYLKSITRIQTFSVLVLFFSLILIVFYMTVQVETTHSLRSVRTQFPQQKGITRHVHLHNVSAGFRQTIPKSRAYWNRLLYSALMNLDKGGNPFNQNSNWSNCRLTNQEFLQINVHDFSSYPVQFRDFLEGMNCRTAPILIDQPNKCGFSKRKTESHTLLLFAIKSSPRNFEQRQAVRETWGREMTYPNGLKVRMVFLLGSSPPQDPDLTPLLSFEAKLYGDILQWDFHETFLNLTLKMNMLLDWTLKSCPHVSFVFSGDDDVFVNTPALVRYIESLEASKVSSLYAGHVISAGSPLRDSNSKYYIPMSFYDGPYPPYAGGGGYLISGSLLESLYSLLHIIPFFPIDDAYVGMCFMALGISPEAHSGFQTFDIRAEDREDLCAYKNLILVHQRSPQELKKLWKGINSSLLACWTGLVMKMANSDCTCILKICFSTNVLFMVLQSWFSIDHLASKKRNVLWTKLSCRKAAWFCYQTGCHHGKAFDCPFRH